MTKLFVACAMLLMTSFARAQDVPKPVAAVKHHASGDFDPGVKPVPSDFPSVATLAG